MRFWFSGPRILGGLIRPGISFAPSDFRSFARAPLQAAPARRQPSFVYVIEDEHGRCKIGVSADPLGRLAQLQSGNAAPMRLAYAAACKSDNAYPIERGAHAMLERQRQSGEWFAISPDMACAAISAASMRLGDPIAQVANEQLAACIAGAALAPAAAPAPPRMPLLGRIGLGLIGLGALCCLIPLVMVLAVFLYIAVKTIFFPG